MYFTKATIIAVAALLSQGLASPLGGSTAPCTTAACCDTQDNVCRTAPGASMADCSAAKNTCYLNAGLPSPFAKRLGGSTAPCTTAACCDDQDNVCRTAPGASMADCSAAKNTCYLNSGLPSPFAKRLGGSTAPCTTAACCDDQDNVCRTAPGASMADCSSAKNTCYLNAGLTSPYAKREAGNCADVRTSCQSSGDANQASCAAAAASCCDDKDNTCRTAPDANMATCSSEKAACYASANLPNPYAKREAGNCADVRTSCQSSGDANQASCAAAAASCCDDKDNTCRTAPDANMATCSSEKAACYTSANLPNPYTKA